MPVLVRQLQGSDCDAVRRLIRGVWTDHFGGHPDPLVREYMNEPESLTDIDPDVYPNPGSTFLVADQDAAIVGCGAVCSVTEVVFEIKRMYVSSGNRRQGIARNILTELLTFARGTGCQKIRLTSNKALVASHRLYESAGFRIATPWDRGAESYAYFYELNEMPIARYMQLEGESR